MGFKSLAQKKKFYELVKQGKMTLEKYMEFEKNTPKHKKLPERLHKKKEDKK